jgi:hypothetical protein
MKWFSTVSIAMSGKNGILYFYILFHTYVTKYIEGWLYIYSLFSVYN